MLVAKQAEEILKALNALPAEKINEVQDFVLFLKDRYGHEVKVDESEVWTDEDIKDLTSAALKYANSTVWAETEEGG